MRNATKPATGEAMPTMRRYRAQAAVDPLLTLVRAYRAEVERFNASPDDGEDGAHLDWLARRLSDATPECWTDEGACEALALVAADMEHSRGGFQAAVLASVLDYVGRRDAWH